MKYFITGTGTDVGKTYVAKLLCVQNSWKALKPVASGGDADAKILNCTPLYQFEEAASPHIAARSAGVKMDFDKIIKYCQNSGADIIEGAGGVMSPLTDTHTNLDLINALNLPVILVAGNYLGSISHTLTALAVLNGRTVKVIINEHLNNDIKAEDIADSIRNFSNEMPIILKLNQPDLSF